LPCIKAKGEPYKGKHNHARTTQVATAKTLKEKKKGMGGAGGGASKKPQKGRHKGRGKIGGLRDRENRQGVTDARFAVGEAVLPKVDLRGRGGASISEQVKFSSGGGKGQ